MESGPEKAIAGVVVDQATQALDVQIDANYAVLPSRPDAQGRPGRQPNSVRRRQEFRG